MVPILWLGMENYETTLQRQQQQRSKLLTGQATECIFAVEHQPVITLGKRYPRTSLDSIQAHGIQLIHSQRGGLATYHGPGQLVIYPIVHISRRKIKVRQWVSLLEQCAIDILREYGVQADRRSGYPGAWVGRNKIAAIGLHIQHGVSIHGLSLNINNSLQPYHLFQPCGIHDGGVTRLADHYKDTVTLSKTATKYGNQLNKYLKSLTL